MKNNFDIEIIKIFKKAEEFKNVLEHEYVGTEHLMLAILYFKNDFTKSLERFNITFDNFLCEVKHTLPPVKKVNDNVYTPLLKNIISSSLNDNKVTSKSLMFHILNEGEGVAIRILTFMDIDVDNLYNYLKNDDDSDLSIYKYGKRLKDYVALNEQVVGRDKEIDLLIQTLLRKKKNNPLLVGDAGVGKSAIVEELVRRIIRGQVPDLLLDADIVLLEMSFLVSGTKYRGEFEERLMQIIEEVKNNPNIILFIDEIHTMVNAGGAEGAIGAGDILKPYLARGDIKCIGATTVKEYEKYFSKDKALIRRFENILIKEPSNEETLEILKKCKNEYEKFHRVKISDDKLSLIVLLADKYFPNKKNPDKSFELLDSVMSYVCLKQKNNIIKLKESEIKKIEISKFKNIENGNFKDALKDNKEENKLKKNLNLIKNGINTKISKEDIFDVLEFKNNIILNINNTIKFDNKIFNKLKKDFNNKNMTYIFKNISIDGVKTFAKNIGYDYFLLNKDNISNLFNKVRYYPSLVIVCENMNDIQVKNILKKIKKEGILEYNDEYYSFNNTISVILHNESSIGFAQNFVSDVPVDQIIVFDKPYIN